MQQKEPCCQQGCQLCLKTHQLQQLRQKGKRELSLQSIYRKDYHSILPTIVNDIPKRRKNESSLSSIAPTRIELQSTYAQNFKDIPARQERHRREQLPINPERSFEELVSTYHADYHNYPVSHPQEAYKIADFQFYNTKSPSPKDTQYSQHYQHRPARKTREDKQKLREKSSKQIRLFDTTQKQAFKGESSSDFNPAILPSHNISSLMHSPALLNSTYQHHFSPLNPVVSVKATHHMPPSNNGSRLVSLGSYYF